MSSSSSPSYKPSVLLSVKKPGSSNVVLVSSTDDATNDDPINEARYWRDKFGLGSSNRRLGSSSSSSSKRKLFAGHQSVRFLTPSNINTAIVSSLSFVTQENLLLVGCGPRVCLYTNPTIKALLKQGDSSSSTTTVQPSRTISTGGHVCTSLAVRRRDGRLVAVGNTQNQVRICDATQRATLVTFQCSQNSSSGGQSTTATTTNLAIRSVAWLRNGKHLVSVGDDAVLRLWSLQHNEEALLVLSGHGDSIRSVVVHQQQQRQSTNTTASSSSFLYKDLCMTGSYDHTIRIWNIELNIMNNDENDDDDDDIHDNSMIKNDNNNRCLAVLNHGAPVEQLLLLPHSSSDPTTSTQAPPWLLSAGGTTLKVWNIQSSACVCTLSTQHSKTITSVLSMNRVNRDNNDDDADDVERRILTGGLDGLIRIHTFDATTGQLAHIHGVRLQDPISSLAVNDTMDRLAIGFTTGQVMVRQRGASIVPKKMTREPRAGTYAYFTRGMNASSSASDFVLESTEKKRKLTAFDMALKQFRYGDALDEALETRQPQAVVAVLEELGKRRGLTIALSNRDEESLEPILSFTVRYITRPQFSSLLIGVANMLCDIYGGVTGQSETIDELFGKLRSQVYNECLVQKSFHRIVGQLDALLTAAEMEDSYDEEN